MSPLEVQIILDELRKLHKRFDESDAQMERFFSRTPAVLEQQGDTVELRLGGSEQFGATQLVVADNWSGLFDGGEHSDEQPCEASVIADNWGGLFEPVPILEERVYEPMKEQLAVDDAATEYTSDDLDAPTCVTAAPTVSAADSVPTVPASVEPSPAQYQRQIQQLENPSSSSFLAAATKDDALCAIPFCGYVGCFGPEFAEAMEKKQVAQEEDECFGFLVTRAQQERLAANVRAEGLGTSARVDDPNLLRCVRHGPIECALRGTPLGGYDGSLDDDPESGFFHLDAPLDQAVGHGRHALATAAVLYADAVGAAGGGPLAWIVAAGPVQTNCSTVCLAGDRCFDNFPVGVLWVEILRWGSNNHVLVPVSYMAELEVVAGTEPAHSRPVHGCLVWLDEQPPRSPLYVAITRRKVLSLMSPTFGKASQY